ncbi:hypothetical protein GTW71_34995, partial [Streptomyces sp. SID6041]|nr:hypothetical protein [Streptomyces sp. SID6041]
MAVTFWSSDIEDRSADPMHFNSTFVEGQSFILACVVIFLAALSCALVNAFRLARST